MPLVTNRRILKSGADWQKKYPNRARVGKQHGRWSDRGDAVAAAIAAKDRTLQQIADDFGVHLTTAFKYGKVRGVHSDCKRGRKKALSC